MERGCRSIGQPPLHDGQAAHFGYLVSVVTGARRKRHWIVLYSITSATKRNLSPFCRAMLKTCGSASGWDVKGRTFPSDRLMVTE